MRALSRATGGRAARVLAVLLLCLSSLPPAAAKEKPPKDYTRNVGGGVNLFSEKDEVAMGRNYSNQLNGKLQLFAAGDVQSYVEALGRRLVAASRKPNLEARFWVVNTREVNAFALPGGFIYVNRGLIDLAATEGQLAGVMAHEIAHVVGRHATKQMSKQLMFLGAVAGASAAVGAKSEKWANVIGMAGGIGAMLAGMKYSRDDEHQADALAAETLAAAGYDPAELAAFFQRMDARAAPGKLGRALALLNTHPPTPDRVRNVSLQVARLNYQPDPARAAGPGLDTCKRQMAAVALPPSNREVTLSNALAAVGMQAATRESALAPLGSREQARTVLDIPGNTVWRDTGLVLREGQLVEFWAEGEIFVKKDSDISCDPSGVFGSGKGFFKPISSLNTGALVGRIVTDKGAQPFPIGTHRVFQAPVAGKLELGINDDNNFDNRGAFRAWILTR